jgi:hypothetical protein
MWIVRERLESACLSDPLDGVRASNDKKKKMMKKKKPSLSVGIDEL